MIEDQALRLCTNSKSIDIENVQISSITQFQRPEDERVDSEKPEVPSDSNLVIRLGMATKHNGFEWPEVTPLLTV